MYTIRENSFRPTSLVVKEVKQFLLHWKCVNVSENVTCCTKLQRYDCSNCGTSYFNALFFVLQETEQNFIEDTDNGPLFADTYIQS
jgi:hypothetical protein